MKIALRICIGLACMLSSFGAIALPISYTFTQIDYPGSSQTWLYGINNTQQIVGTRTSDWSGFLREGDGSFSQIAYPGSSVTYPFSINDAGVISGTYFSGCCSYGFLLNVDGTFQSITPPGGSDMNVYGINNSGQIVENSNILPVGMVTHWSVLLSRVPTLLSFSIRFTRYMPNL